MIPLGWINLKLLLNLWLRRYLGRAHRRLGREDRKCWCLSMMESVVLPCGVIPLQWAVCRVELDGRKAAGYNADIPVYRLSEEEA
jgi:hypothetical protein